MKALLFWVFCSLVGNLLAERPLLIQQATFLSTNFENILVWDNGTEGLPGTVYNVQYKRYGESIWQNKSECQNITQHFCNLTQETEKFNERYYARVRATVPGCCTSDWLTAHRFCPREDTNIGDLEGKSNPSVQSIRFSIQPPYTPLRDEDNQILTVEDIFSQFGAIRYEITIFCGKTQQTWVKTENSKEFVIPDLEPDTVYNGTVYMRYLDKKSKPYVFRVRTLPDQIWLPYLFGIPIFVTLLIFAAIYYCIYKYIKLHSAKQPASLDFKDMSHFQPLTLTTEHVLRPHDSSKPLPVVPEMQSVVQVNQHLQEILEPPRSFLWPETAYQQQDKMAASQTAAHPVGQEDDLPMGYAPQAVKINAPRTVRDHPSTSTYGICVKGMESMNKTNSRPDRATALSSLVEGSIGDGLYKAQKPKWSKIERGMWETKFSKEPAVALENAEQTPQLFLQGDTQEMPQPFPSLLEARDPATSKTGSYRTQPEALLPSTLEAGQSAVSEGDRLLPSLPWPSSFAHSACNSLSQDLSTGPWTTWDVFTWTDRQWQPSGFQTTDCVTQKSEGLAAEAKPHIEDSNALDSAQGSGLLTGLFRDLELKIQWDSGPEENPAIY